MLKYDILYTICIENVDEQKECIHENINIDLCIDCSINEYNRTEFIADKASSNHL